MEESTDETQKEMGRNVFGGTKNTTGAPRVAVGALADRFLDRANLDASALKMPLATHRISMYSRQ